MTATLPDGFVVRLGRHTRRFDGVTLAGGFPTRVLRLRPAAARLLEGDTVTVRSPAAAVLADRLLDAAMADPVLEALPDRDEAVTVVVPVRDRPAELGRLLASVPAGVPVVVVDDASLRPDRVAAVAAEQGARLVALPVNRGPGGARNAGLAAVGTPLVAFVDSDMVLGPDVLRLLARHFADPRVGMVVPRIAGLPTAPSWIAAYEDARSSLDLGTDPASVRPRSPVSWASTACVIVRVAALGSGFDARLRVGEDVDLTWRLVAAGWRVRYEPAVRAHHEHRVRLGDWLLRKAVYGSGAAALAARHPDAIAPAVLAPWSAGVAGALLAQRRWSLPVAAGLTAWAAVRIARRLPAVERPVAVTGWLVGNGVLAAVAQGAALLLRHWWPAAAVGCLVSRRIRRAVLLAAVADAVLERRRTGAALSTAVFLALRRLDDLAYGAGVWWSALRAGSPAALLPALGGTRPRMRGSDGAGSPYP